MNPTRRWFVKAFSGAILTTLLGVKAWRLEVEEPEFYCGTGSARPYLVDWNSVPWSLSRDGHVVASGVGMTPEGVGLRLHT